MKMPVTLGICFMVLVQLSAHTVMVTYDVTINDESAEVLYAVRASAELESSIMGELFDLGHIVFNHPGTIYLGAAAETGAAAEKQNFRNTVLQRSIVAARGGADLFMYLNLHFEGKQEDDMYLSRLEYEISRIGIGQPVLDNAHIQYASSPRIDPADASRMFFNFIEEKSIF